MAQFYHNNKKNYNKRCYIYFDNKAFRTKMNVATRGARRKSNTALDYWFIDSNIFPKAGNKTATATATGEDNLIIKTAAIFKNFRRKLAENTANI